MLDLPTSPLQQLDDPLWNAAGVELWVKRDDLFAPQLADPLCGNKCRKLRYNLMAARERGCTRLLSLGGPYSNNLAAVASAGKQFGFHTTGWVRGEPVDNPTIRQLRRDGMHLIFWERQLFRELRTKTHLPISAPERGTTYFIPEGGSNVLAQAGLVELAEELLHQCTAPPDYVAVACGTGGTAAGLISGLAGRSYLLGVSALKGNWMPQAVADWLNVFQYQGPAAYQIITDQHHGGFAKISPELLQFMERFEAQHGILLESIYTGKLFYALYNQLQSGFFRTGQRVVAIHTGGLQGRFDLQEVMFK